MRHYFSINMEPNSENANRWRIESVDAFLFYFFESERKYEVFDLLPIGMCAPRMFYNILSYLVRSKLIIWYCATVAFSYTLYVQVHE